MSKDNARGPGRPALVTPEVWQTVLDLLADGVPLERICRWHRNGCPERGIDPDPAFPASRTIRIFIQKAAEREEEDGEAATICADYASARAAGCAAIAEETLDIADDSSNDYMMGKAGPVLDTENIQRSKLRIDTRMRLLRAWSPDEFGDRMNVAGVEGKPVTVIRKTYSTEEGEK